MSDSFFGFDTAHMSDDDLGPPDLDDDRYNSETFGADAGEWEEDDHEKISAYLERERSVLHQLGNGRAPLSVAADQLPGATDIERGLSKLVTDDELDDPCIMSVRRSSRPAGSVPIPHPQFGRPRSPPISSLLESDISGSPSANSIWSTTPTRPANAFDDPAIMSVGRPRAPPPAARLPLPAAAKVRTVEELEHDLLARSPARPPPPPGFGRGLPPPPPAGPPPMDFSRPPPMRAPPPPPGEQFRLPNTHLPPPSVTSILPPQLMNKDRGSGGAGRGLPAGRGAPSHHQHQHQHQRQHQQPHQQPQWRQDQERRRQDPYAGLMTSRERQWLLNIQRMQIKGNSDYYFQHFNSRKLSQGRRDSRGGHGRDQHKDRDDKHTDHRLYKPPEMENSLGKLQVASVTAPRKIIDLGVITQESADGSRDHKEAKRDRQTLLLIEQLYHQVMLVEGADRQAAGEPESEAESAEPAGPRLSPEEVRAAASGRLWSALSREQQLVHILAIRKGKGLVLRCLPILSSQQYYQIALTLLKHLAVVLHKDKLDNMLHKFYVCMQMVVSNSDLAQITELTAALTASTDLDSATPAKTPLQLVACSPFGVSVALLLLLRGDQLCQQQPTSGAAERWRPLAAGLTRCLSALPQLAPPLEPVPAALLAKHVPEPRLVARLVGDVGAT
ncbi:protein PAT1 homolog 1-like [Amphibalanus amphitrite]|uniref:protein PAT1 homolog 1-like n=1 Tax=Amphibalanus amphitrite TaxID=1232801 RepID=UPI001C91ACE1|nr:protein PAT1 homolog 1-like [Amphibalanus amphitrite]